MVYAGISIDGYTNLNIIRNGALAGRRYKDKILRHIAVPYVSSIGDGFILIVDNYRPHRANLMNDIFLVEEIIRMEWSARSPDMKPIEHVYHILGRRVAGHLPPPQTL